METNFPTWFYVNTAKVAISIEAQDLETTSLASSYANAAKAPTGTPTQECQKCAALLRNFSD